MTNTTIAPKLTLLAACKEIGWLPLLLMGIGGLSVIDIMEKAVLGDISLITPLRIVLDGYQRIAALAAAFVERPLAPLMTWLSRLFQYDLFLQPYWRSLFLLQGLAVAPIVRATWQAGQKFDAAIAAIVMYAGCLAVSLVVGLAPQIPVWWFQGFIAALMVLTLWLTFGIAAALGPAGGEEKLDVRGGVATALFSAFVGFVLAALIALAPQIGAGAAVVAFGISIALFGLLFIAGSFRTGEIDMFRLGLAIFGGFIAAALVLLADAIVKALS